MFLTATNRKKGLVFFCGTWILGLFVSKFLLSLSMLGILLLALIRPQLGRELRAFAQQPAFWMLMGFFLLVALGGIHSEDHERWLSRLRVALPFLILPFAFGRLPRLSRSAYLSVYALLVVAALGAGLASFGFYLWDYQAIQESLSHSKAIPTLSGDHIRTSLLLAFAALMAYYLYQENFQWRWRWEPKAYLLLAMVLAIFVHILAVRSGLLALYAGIGISILRFILIRKRYLLGTFLFLSLLSAPMIAYYAVPSFQAKIDLTAYNYELYLQDSIGEFSDTQRMVSYEMGLKVGHQQPWVGVGLGDVQAEQERMYAEYYPQQKVLLPHNLFLTLYAGSGLLGLLGFLWIFFFPLFYRKNYQHYPLLISSTVLLSSFISENTLLIAIGTAFYLLFTLLPLHYLRTDDGPGKDD